MNNKISFRVFLTIFLPLLAIAVVAGAPIASAGERAALRPIDGLAQSVEADTICFASEGVVACVHRIGIRSSGTLTDRVRSLILAMITGPSMGEQALGIQSALPAGAALADVQASPNRAVIRFDLPDSFLSSLDAGATEDVNEQIATTLTPFNFARIDVEARDAKRGVFRPLSAYLAPVAIPAKPGELAPPAPSGGQPPGYGSPQVQGGLRGKTVFVSAGHGWYWSTSQGQYRTQRPHYPSSPYPSGQGIVEDFNNAEIVDQFLLQYLWNAGADAWTVRERDMNSSMIVVDNSSLDFSVAGSWLLDAGLGYGGSHRYASTLTSAATATATWTFTPGVAARYGVYVWFPNAAIRTPAARYFIEHAGGTTAITITQQRDGNNWRYVGTYPFKAGVAGRVRLTNQSTAAGLNVLADAVRIGGGIGDQIVGGAPTPSGRPRWEEQARQYAQWVGLPDADSLNDVIVRPIFSEWEYEAGEDAVYISYHSNGYSGYNTTARGTETYIHSFEPTPNSDILQSYVHTELINDIHAGWETAWPDRGQKSQDLGELRLLETMPGVLIENGYHDNPQDVEAEKDPRFNLLSARAIYHGLVRYWNSQDPTVPLVFLPEPPTRLRIRNSGPGQVTASWAPGPTDGTGLLGDLATTYRVYTSADGFGWSAAMSTSNASLVLSGLAPGQLIYVRVAGVNAGGESFPTPVLAARVASNDVAPVLIVYGFDRIDRFGLVRQFDGAEGYSRRMFLDRVNRYDYIIQHASGITHAFDSAVHAAVTNGEVGLGNYAVVDWISGEEQSPDVALSAADQALLQSFLESGGALLISGAELGFDLVANGIGPAFYSNALHASFVADDAFVYGVGSASGPFAGIAPFSFDDGTHGTYDADFPDVFTALSPAAPALLYNGGSTAALSYASGPCTRLIYMGFPLETIYPQATRDALMAKAMSFLDDCVPSSGPDTAIASPIDGAAYNALPSFNGTAGGPNGVSSVQVAILSGTLYYNGSTFAAAPTWLVANGTLVWSYALPALADGDYGLKARALESASISDTTPSAVTFTLDTIAPTAPSLITPTGGITIVTAAPTFVWTGGGNPSGFELELDGVSEVLYSAALSATRGVVAGSHTWRVRAFDRAANLSDWSPPGSFNTPSLGVYLPLVMRNAAPGGQPPKCYEAVVNGGFEQELLGWTTPSINPIPAVVTSPQYEGGHSVRVGSGVTTTAGFGFSSVQQSLSVPVTATSALLSFQRYRISGDTANDLQYVALLSGSTVVDYLVYERVDDPAWFESQFDLIAFAGDTLDLRFSVKNDGTGGATGMFVDAVSLRICGP